MFPYFKNFLSFAHPTFDYLVVDVSKKITRRLIKCYLGEISIDIENQINQLSTEKVEALAGSLLDFKTQADLINWLNSQN